jgi:hypothetical protein
MVRRSSLALATVATTLALLGGVAPLAHAADLVFPVLAPPTDIVSYPTDKGAFLSWTHAPNVAGYNLYRRTADQTADKAALVNTAGPLTNSFVTDTTAALGTAYLYNVKSVYQDAAGNAVESPASPDLPGTPLAANVGPFALYNLNTPNPGSASVDANNIMTIRASGQDIWATQLQGMFYLAPVSGDFQITVKIAERPTLPDPDNGDPAAKVGLVYIPGDLHRSRGGLPLASENQLPFAYFYNSVQRDPEFLLEGGKSDLSGFGQSDNSPTSDETTFPTWLRLTRKGTMITASFAQGAATPTTFQELGPAFELSEEPLPELAYVGVAVTARKEGQYVIGKIDLTTLKIERAP